MCSSPTRTLLYVKLTYCSRVWGNYFEAEVQGVVRQWGLWIICNRNLVLGGENMYNFTYLGGRWNEKLEFWNLVVFVRKSIQNGGEVLGNWVFIYIVVVDR